MTFIEFREAVLAKTMTRSKWLRAKSLSQRHTGRSRKIGRVVAKQMSLPLWRNPKRIGGHSKGGERG
jgi:hypothetical protein